ncbi:MAG: glycoside hydrolase family 3 N-terminal domain-containing protein [Eubacteriales bacterium]
MKKYLDNSLNIDERTADLLSRMTLEEKVAQIDIARGVEFATIPHAANRCSIDAESDFNWEKVEETFGDRGVGYIHDAYTTPKVFNKIQKYMVEKTRLGIPCIFTGEALHGISYPGASIFPVPLALAATFNPSAVNKIGSAIAYETRSLGMHEILAPNLDVAREPRWGRVEETFGEDTYLSSQMAYAIITGEQKGDISRSDSVICEPKHYCVHGIPEGGLNCATARVGVREIESVYLPVFEAGIVKAGAYNVMACYNSIDNEPVIASKHYLTDILKKRYRMKGISRADWGAVKRIRYEHRLTDNDKDAVKIAFNAGLDMQGCCDYDMSFWEQTLIDLINEGEVDIARVDDAVARVLRMKFDLGLFENPYTDEDNYAWVIRCEEHKAASLEAAKQAITLLKNDGVLPVSKAVKSIALIGPSSASQKVGGYSSTPDGYTINSVYDELKAALGNSVVIRQCSGCGIAESKDGAKEIDGQPHLTNTLGDNIADSIDEALEIASKSDLIIIVGGDDSATSGEGVDRCDLRLHGKQRDLIEKAAALNIPTVLVLENGKSIDLSLENKCVGAILVSWFGGEFGARAITDTLLGKNNPAGRLPISFPKNTLTLPCYYSRLPTGRGKYLDGDSAALFSFGHGLSYTTFKYSDLRIERQDKYDFIITVNVKNIGSFSGDEVVQLYINDIISSMATPDMLLKGFERVTLLPNEEKSIVFKLDFDSFKLFNVDYEWVVEDGMFEIMVGASSTDIRLEKEIEI